jgi:hypothetical protein
VHDASRGVLKKVLSDLSHVDAVHLEDRLLEAKGALPRVEVSYILYEQVDVEDVVRGWRWGVRDRNAAVDVAHESSCVAGGDRVNADDGVHRGVGGLRGAPACSEAEKHRSE